jgi:uncharacterized membrane protein YraQ (UPF0718 family)
MNELIQNPTAILTATLQAVLTSLAHNWLPLALAIVIAAVMKVHANPERLQRALSRRKHAAILGAVAVGAFTPLCACGTMAVVLGMLTATVPWAPIMAFLTSSPLMSPDGFVLLTGLIGLGFAVAVALASIAVGLGAGYLTHLIETRTGWLRGQTRFAACDDSKRTAACACSPQPATLPVTASAACACAAPAAPETAPCCVPELSATGDAALADPTLASFASVRSLSARLRLRETVRALKDVGAKQILLSFAIFVAVGYLINRLVPVQYVAALFGSGHVYSVPFAALVGLPLYVTTESSVPIIQSLLQSGAGRGAMLAFMITGPATSAWVVAGLTTFMRARAIALYVGLVLAGGILAGYGYDLLLALR